ncbi:MAG: LD-carboxypeptidase [Bacteroidales bacterium]|nr:LD-carboxypeptidase [Bacteroidales bacterium]
MITPPYLKPDDRVAVVAPAGRVPELKVGKSARVLEQWGLKVAYGKHLFGTLYSFSGHDSERLADLQQALDDPSIRAVICARGGYGSIRIIDRIDFSEFARHPKWIVGFSDITVLHSHIQRAYGIETLHAAMPSGYPDDPGKPSLASLHQALSGHKLEYHLPIHSLSRSGICRGILTGGNLSILCSLLGSNSVPDTKGKILFIEEVGEHLYRIDRMMWALRRSGMLEHLAGLVTGDFSDIRDTADDFGKNAQEIVMEAVSGFDFPVCMGFPAGHLPDNRALIMGREVGMIVDQDAASLSFEEHSPAS